MPTLDSKRDLALQQLGSNYVLHPDYVPNPRHSNNPAIYVTARQPYLLAVRLAASADRYANKFFHNAQRLCRASLQEAL